MNEKHASAIAALKTELGKSVVTKQELVDAAEKLGLERPRFLFKPAYRASRGLYNLDGAAPVAAPSVAPEPVAQVAMAPAANLNVRPVIESLNVETAAFSENLVPEKDSLYVPFGNHKDVKAVMKSNRFFPLYVTGLSGNGKTFMIEQVAAELGREVIRVNFTIETDEDDLIGGFRLVNGETKFFKGPVIKAMERGAVLLADEIDLANPAKIMCLQSILEGKGYFIKKTGEYIKPAAGFTIIATANTKGRGSEDGKFIGTNIMNEAFLERFKNTYDQEYPSPAIEKKIVNKFFGSLGVNDEGFAAKLVDWADVIRKTYADGGVDEIISTRRLIHIADTYAIFNDKLESVKKCISRFDEDTKEAFLDLYTKIDAEAVEVESGEQTENDLEVPF